MVRNSDESKDFFRCDISPETLRVTSCKYFVLDQLVNLERPLLPTSRLGTGSWDMSIIVL